MTPEETQAVELSRVFRYAERWGVKIALGDTEAEDPHRRYHRGPTGATGIWWPDRSILIDPKSLDDWDLPNMLVHEIGHCLNEKDPEDVEVENLVLAFDWASHRFLKLSNWSRWMDSFVISQDGDSWDVYNLRQRSRALDITRTKAVEAGVLDASYRPTFVRPSWARGDTPR